MASILSMQAKDPDGLVHCAKSGERAGSFFSFF
jgi:hypothetical protein